MRLFREWPPSTAHGRLRDIVLLYETPVIRHTQWDEFGWKLDDHNGANCVWIRS